MCFILLGLVANNHIVAIVILTSTVATMGFNAASGNVNQLDLGGPLAGVLMGVGNTLGAIAGIVAPLVAGAVLGDQDSNAQRWHTGSNMCCFIFLLSLSM